MDIYLLFFDDLWQIVPRSLLQKGEKCLFLLVDINIVAFCEPGGVSEALLLLNVLICFSRDEFFLALPHETTSWLPLIIITWTTSDRICFSFLSLFPPPAFHSSSLCVSSFLSIYPPSLDLRVLVLRELL